MIGALIFLLALPVAASQVVATVNGKAITARDIESRVAASLLPLRQQEYEVKAEAARAIAFERLKAAEAARRGISVDELYRLEVTSKVPAPTDGEINTMLRFLRSRLPQEPAEARAAVIESLRNQKTEQREMDFRKEIFARATFELRIQPPRAKIDVTGNDPVRGKAGAPVTIIEFSDFQCPYCGQSQETLREIEKEYAGRVRLVFKHFPLEEIHENARLAAEASLCANDQRKFWELHDWMFNNVQKLSRDQIVAAAPAMEMDASALGKCIDEHRHAKDIDADFADGQEAGVRGTPTFFVNGRLISGKPTFENFHDVIDQELRK
ncbi:MAG TPA: thioredoxin domain-containing protein [Thermoanaerobaculia bacterium]|nr:thioredoxin domain-containing protein [Thermoanaerobaculia bacterium]